MKLLVLTFGILLILSFTSSQNDTSSTSIPETYNLVNPTGNLPIAKPGCNTTCGDLIVPYPFGIGLDSNCSIGKGFDIHCNTSSKPHKLTFFTADGRYRYIKKISDSTIRTSNLVASQCYYPNGTSSSDSWLRYNLTEGSAYTFSQLNRFTVLGCNDYAWLSAGITHAQEVYTGCMSFCSDLNWDNPLRDACSGDGCCQSPIPRDTSFYFTRVHKNSNDDDTSERSCTYAFVGEQNTYTYNSSMNLSDISLFSKMVEDDVPVVLDWAVGNISCAEAKLVTEGYACQSNSVCVDSGRKSGGYRCQCMEGRYQGNPYLYPGCQDIDECKDPTTYPCYGVCINTPGNYTCECKKGYTGDATVPNGCKKKPFYQTLLFYLGIGLASPAIVIGLLVLYFIVQKRKLVKLKEMYYEQNGGEILRDKLKTKEGVGLNSVNIFRIEEIKEATDNFAESKVIGRGGNGTVYKGTLTDMRFVAIKKSQRVDQGQREEFINEMVILTQINHTNVVQLIGFCLETEVPLLAYEYVSNDTLHRHIHNTKSSTRRLSWGTRLRIAHESAGALAYLHTDARMSIIHRDVKSTNILLDENFTAKIADFGASRLVPLGHDEVVTLVQGTFGYLDPEYFHTGQLTDRSDVYSFGVVLAELLTGQQPINMERCPDDRNLATYFLKAVKENSFFDILEEGVVKEAAYEQLIAISDLVCRCLNQVGGIRPSMKEVTVELDNLRKLGKFTNSVSENNYNETSSLMIEMEPNDLYTVPLIPMSDTFGDSSITSDMQDMMLSLQSVR